MDTALNLLMDPDFIKPEHHYTNFFDVIAYNERFDSDNSQTYLIIFLICSLIFVVLMIVYHALIYFKSDYDNVKTFERKVKRLEDKRLKEMTKNYQSSLQRNISISGEEPNIYVPRSSIFADSSNFTRTSLSMYGPYKKLKLNTYFKKLLCFSSLKRWFLTYNRANYDDIPPELEKRVEKSRQKCNFREHLEITIRSDLKKHDASEDRSDNALASGFQNEIGSEIEKNVGKLSRKSTANGQKKHT